jgi:hypothetical protein
MIDFKGVRRTLRALLCLEFVCLTACSGGGGGGGAPETPWTPLADMEFRSGTPAVKLTTVGEGNTFELQCTVSSRGYFTQSAHLAIVAQQDLSLPGLQGNGLAIGRTGDLGYLNIDKPRFSIETWGPSAGLFWGHKRDGYLPPEKLSPELAEDTPYPFTLTIAKYSIRYTAANYDSGPWDNKNNAFDFNAKGLVFANAFGLPDGVSVSLKSCRYRWSAQ